MNRPRPLCVFDSELDHFIREDVPYFDLTTLALGIGDASGMISFTTRHPTVICGTEEAACILERCGATVTLCMASGTLLATGTLFLSATGTARALHQGWRVALSLLEYVSGIATRTRELVTAAQQINPQVVVVTTRKVFPGTKALAVKAILAGGAMPHRLGLSESVLIFAQHLAFLDGWAGLIERLPALRQQCQEKKIGVEVERLEDALMLAEAGVDVVQFDKLPPSALQEAVVVLKRDYPQLLVVAAGGITQANVQRYAATGVDVLATTAVYSGKPVDIQVNICHNSTGSS